MLRLTSEFSPAFSILRILFALPCLLALLCLPFSPATARPSMEGMWVLHHLETVTRTIANGSRVRVPGHIADTGTTKVAKDPNLAYNVNTNPLIDRTWSIKANEASMTCSQRGENYKTTWILPSTVLSGESLSGAMNIQTIQSPNPMNTPVPSFSAVGKFHHGYFVRNADGLPLTSWNPAQSTGIASNLYNENYFYPVGLDAVKGPGGYLNYAHTSMLSESSLPFLSVDIAFGGVTFPKVFKFIAVYVWANKVELSAAGKFRVVSSIRGVTLGSWMQNQEDYAPATWFVKMPSTAAALGLKGKYFGTDGRLLTLGEMTIAGASTETVFFNHGAGYENGYEVFVTVGNRQGSVQSYPKDAELFPRWESRVKVAISKEGYDTIETEIDFSDYFYTHYYAGISGMVRDSRGNPVGGATMTFTPFFEGAWGSPRALATYSDGSFRATHKHYTFDQNSSGNELNLRIGVKTVYISNPVFSNTALPGKDILEDYVLTGKTPPGEIKLVKALALPHGNVNLSFLDGISHYVNFEIGIDWGGNDPGKVVFETTAGRTITIPATGNRESALIDVGKDVGPAGKIYVQAIDSSGEVKSKRRFLKTRVMPGVPLQDVMVLSMKKDVSGSFEYVSGVEKVYNFFKANMPGTECPTWMPYFGGKTLSLDFLPEIGLKVTSSGVAEYGIGVNNPNKAGKKVDSAGNPIPTDIGKEVLAKMATVEFKLQPFIRIIGNYSDSAGKWVWGGHAKIFGSAEAKKVFPFVVGTIPCFAAASFSLSANSAFGIKEFIAAAGEFKKYGDIRLNAVLEGKVGAGVESLVAAEGFVSGNAEVQFDWPLDGNTSGFVNPAYNLRHRRFTITLGGRAYALVWKWEREFKTWKWPGEQPASKVVPPADGFAGAVSALSMPGLGAPIPIDRDYLRKGIYGAFNDRAGSPGEVGALSVAGGARVSCLQAAVFPFADPFLAAATERRYAAWLYDDPARASLDRTVLRVSMRDDSALAPTWTTPRPVSDDGTGDFHPFLTAFDDGILHAAWEDLRELYTEGIHTLDDMLGGMEISVCRATGATLEWSVSERLTADSFMDRSPHLAGSVSNDVMITWIRNESNHMTGLTTKPNKLMFSRWNGTAWSAPAEAAAVPYRLLAYSMAYDGTKAVVVLSCGISDSPEASDLATMADEDDPFAAVRDRELFSVFFSDGSWGGLTRLTQDETPDDNPQVAFDSGQVPVLVWVRDGSLTYARDLEITFSTQVRRGEYSSNLAGARLAADPSGALAVVWPEGRKDTTDLEVLFYDPIENAWGNSRTLTSDDETERSVSAAFTSAGTISAVYHRNRYVDGNTLPPDDQGGAGVMPVLDNSDIYMLDYKMVRDLAIRDGSLGMTPEAALPGSQVYLKAIIENRGDFAARNPVVEFGHGGGRDNAGNFIDFADIGRVTYQGLLLPGASVEVSLEWVVPEGFSDRNLVAEADPDETFETLPSLRGDNLSAFPVMLPDLILLPASWTETFPGILDIALTVVNAGTSASRPTVVELRDTVSGVVIRRAEIAALAVGQTSEATVSWNVNRLRAERVRFALEATIDPDGLIGELNEANNIRPVNIDGELPSVAVEPGKRDFGLLAAFSAGAEFSFEVLNNGTAALTVHRVFIDGRDPFAFKSLRDDATGTVLLPGDSALVKVAFSPPGPGNFKAFLAVETDDPARPIVTAGLDGSMAPGSSQVDSTAMAPAAIRVLQGATVELSGVRAIVTYQDGTVVTAAPVGPGSVQAPGLRSWSVTSGAGIMNGSVFQAPGTPETGTVTFNFGDGANTASVPLTIKVTAPPAVSGIAVGIPTVGFVIYSRDNGAGGSDLYRVPLDGSAASALTSSGAVDRSPAISPDGKRVAFVSTRDGNAEIYSMAADGTGQTRLTENSVVEGWPFFNPDGTKIYFVSQRDGNAEIYSMDADGTGQTRLTENDARDDQPCPSPDGSRVYFVSERDGNAEIYTMNPDGTLPVRLTRSDVSEAAPFASGTRTFYAMASTSGGIYCGDKMVKESRKLEPGSSTYGAGLPWISVSGDLMAYEIQKTTDGGYNYYYSLEVAGGAGRVLGAVGNAPLRGDRPTLWTSGEGDPIELVSLDPGKPGQGVGKYPIFLLRFSGSVDRESVERAVVLRRGSFLSGGVPVKVRWEWAGLDSAAAISSDEAFEPGEIAGLDLLHGAIGVNGFPIAGFAGTLSFPVRGGTEGERIIFSSYNSYMKISNLFGLLSSESGYSEIGTSSFSGMSTITGPRILPGGNGILFGTNHFGLSEIYRLNLDGTGLRLLSTPTHHCHVADVSDDGEYLLYTLYSDRKISEWGNGRDLWLMPTAGGEKVMVAGGSGSADGGIFVPGTNLVVCTMTVGEMTRDFFVVDRAGGNRIDLFKSVEATSFPVLSVDGKKIFVPLGPSDGQKIWSVGIDGAAAVQLSSGEGNHVFPVPFPDGSKVLFVDSVFTGTTHVSTILMVMADGTGQRVFVGGDASYSMPRVSPDSMTVAYNRSVEVTDDWGFTTDMSRIHVTTADGTDSMPVSAEGYSSSISQFTADGRIIFTSARKIGTGGNPVNGLFTVDTDGSNETRISSYSPVAGFFREPAKTIPAALDPAAIAGLVLTPASAVVKGGSILDLRGVSVRLAATNGTMMPSGTAEWTVVSGPGLIAGIGFSAPLAGGMTVLKASVRVGESIFTVDFPVKIKPVMVNLLLPVSNAVLYAGRRIRLDELGATAKFSDGSVAMVNPEWTIKTGGGIVEASEFEAPRVSGFVVLEAAYTHDGETLRRELSIFIHVGLSSISLIPSDIRLSAGSIADLTKIVVLGRYGTVSREVPGAVWSIKSGEGTLDNAVFTAPSTAAIDTSKDTVLTASYTLDGTLHTADLTIRVLVPVLPRIRNLAVHPGRSDSSAALTGVSALGDPDRAVASLEFGTIVEANGPCKVSWEAFDPDTSYSVRVFWSLSDFDPALLEPWISGADSAVPATLGLKPVNMQPVSDQIRAETFREAGVQWNPMSLALSESVSSKVFPEGIGPGARSKVIHLYAIALDNTRQATAAGGQIVKSLPLELVMPSSSGTGAEVAFSDLSTASVTALPVTELGFMISDDSGGMVSVYLFHAPQKDLKRAVPCLGIDGSAIGGTFQSAAAALQDMVSGGAGTHIVGWDTSLVSSGDYYILAVGGDGINEPKAFWSVWPVKVTNQADGNTAPTIEWLTPAPGNLLRNVDGTVELKIRFNDGEGDTLRVDILANRVNAEVDGMFTVVSGITVENTLTDIDMVVPFDPRGLKKGAYYLMAKVGETGRAGLDSLSPTRAWSVVPIFVDPGSSISDLVAGPFRIDPSDVAKASVDITFRTGTAAVGKVVYGTVDLPGIAVPGTLGTSHMITLDGLVPGTAYGFQVEADFADGTTAILDNAGELYGLQVPTAIGSPGVQRWISGMVADSSGQALAGVLAKVFVVRDVGTATEKVSQPILVTSGSDGIWAADIGAVRDFETGAFMDPPPFETDVVRVELVAPDGKRRFADSVALTGIETAATKEQAVSPETLGSLTALALESENLEHSLPIFSGFNLVAAPIETTVPLTARGVLDLCGDMAVAVYHYSASDGRYQVLMRLTDGGVFGDDFTLDMIQGFFLKATRAGVLKLSGKKIARASDQPVVKGFNMMTVPFGRHYPASVRTELTALELLKRLGPDGIAVYTYDGGVYKTVMRLFPGSGDNDFFAPAGDFTLEQGKGYFIKSGNNASFGTDM